MDTKVLYLVEGDGLVLGGALIGGNVAPGERPESPDADLKTKCSSKKLLTKFITAFFTK